MAPLALMASVTLAARDELRHPSQRAKAMDASFHRFSELFAQLGLPAEPAAIEDFLRSHGPLAPELQLADAPFWTPSQATLLRESLRADADWAEVVDQLNAALRLDLPPA